MRCVLRSTAAIQRVSATHAHMHCRVASKVPTRAFSSSSSSGASVRRTYTNPVSAAIVKMAPRPPFTCVIGGQARPKNADSTHRWGGARRRILA